MRRQLKTIVESVPQLARTLRRIRDERAIRSLAWRQVPGFDFGMLGGNWFAAGDYADIGGGIHERHELAIIDTALASVDVLIDVGANSGMFSLLAASRGKRAIAFEPMPQNLTILLKNIQRNRMEDAIEVLPLGVADRVGIAPFFGSGQVASLVAGWGGQLKVDPLLVPITTLDTLLSDRLADVRFAVKIDVEGAELAVLDGAAKLLERRPPLLIENSITANHPGGFNPAFATIFERLWAIGYTAFLADAERTLVTSALLASWVANRHVDAGTENYYFERV